MAAEHAVASEPVQEQVQPSEAAVAAAEGTQQDAQALFEQGQRLFDQSKYEEAAELFSQAVEQQIEKYGEMAVETVDAVIAYGKALLRHAVASSGVLGGASTGGAAPQPEQPPAAGPSQPATAASGSSTAGCGSSSVRKNPNFHFGGDLEEEEEQPENESGAAGDEEDQEPAEEDKEDDLETAFQMLDMARAILSKVDTDDAKLKLAGVHNALGEVATESERFADAATEYLSALDVSSSVLPEHDRKIAEIHLMIALSYEFVPSTTKDINTSEGEASRLKAVEHAELAKKVLLLRKDFLNKKEHEAGKAAGADFSKDSQAELQDIEEVLTELDAKIEDLKTMSEDTKAAQRDQQMDQAFGVSQAPPNAPVNDLGSMGLVKKRKAPAGDQGPAASALTGAAPGPFASLPKLGSISQSSAENADKGKRKAEDGVAPEDNKDTAAATSAASAPKKAKVDDA